jgi:hypothetical protein
VAAEVLDARARFDTLRAHLARLPPTIRARVEAMGAPIRLAGPEGPHPGVDMPGSYMVAYSPLERAFRTELMRDHAPMLRVPLSWGGGPVEVRLAFDTPELDPNVGVQIALEGEGLSIASGFIHRRDADPRHNPLCRSERHLEVGRVDPSDGPHHLRLVWDPDAHTLLCQFDDFVQVRDVPAFSGELALELQPLGTGATRGYGVAELLDLTVSGASPLFERPTDAWSAVMGRPGATRGGFDDLRDDPEAARSASLSPVEIRLLLRTRFDTHGPMLRERLGDDSFLEQASDAWTARFQVDDRAPVLLHPMLSATEDLQSELVLRHGMALLADGETRRGLDTLTRFEGTYAPFAREKLAEARLGLGVDDAARAALAAAVADPWDPLAFRFRIEDGVDEPVFGDRVPFVTPHGIERR